ncbi:hypothetical protein [Massilia sp. CF038]|uniref:hypothetical protein n=1 Tax=Massilia sp. CF038 TaxID=1881045 RepID=UPI000910B9A9|nr:hypothetical protein [Massilia sp. CF038]SHH19115.1 hypothetical protein SAMN05428948_3236 [Massilia sp. CF038]
MKTIQPSPLLKWSLLADAIACAPLALLQVTVPDWLARQTAIPASLLTGSGAFLLLYTALLLILASRPVVWKSLIDLIIVGNLGWAIACMGLLVAGPFAATTLGGAYLVLQTLAVVALAVLEWRGLAASIASTRSRDGHARLA